MKTLFLSIIISLAAFCQTMAAADKGTAAADDDEACCPDIEKLENQARGGSPSAFRRLSECYQHGWGVEKNHINMFFMNRNYCMTLGRSDFFKIFVETDADSPIARVVRRGQDITLDDMVEISAEIRDEYPADAKVFDAFCTLFSQETEENDLVMSMLEDAREMGSSLSVLALCTLYDEKNMEDEYVSLVEEEGKHIPYLYNRLGLKIFNKYKENADEEQMRRAAAYLEKADRHAFLSLEGAEALLSLYEGGYGADCSRKDIRRLKKLITRLNNY